MRTLALILFTLLAQASFSTLLPEAWSPPDLWFLLAVTLAARTPPLEGLAFAFALGLGQDLVSAGYPGLHALGLATAAYAFYRLKTLLRWEEPLGKGAVLLGSFVAKWAGVFLVVFWLRLGLVSPLTFTQVFAPELALTLLLAAPYLKAAKALLGPEAETGHA